MFLNLVILRNVILTFCQIKESQLCRFPNKVSCKLDKVFSDISTMSVFKKNGANIECLKRILKLCNIGNASPKKSLALLILTMKQMNNVDPKIISMIYRSQIQASTWLNRNTAPVRPHNGTMFEENISVL